MSSGKQPSVRRLVSADSIQQDPLRIAVVGYGYWGPNLARNVIERPELELAALCERDAARAAAFQAKAPGVPVFAELDDVLADPSIDARARGHAAAHPLRHRARSARGGKHVLVEKPLARTAAEARGADRGRRAVRTGC